MIGYFFLPQDLKNAVACFFESLRASRHIDEPVELFEEAFEMEERMSESRGVADEWMRSNDPGPTWDLIDGEDDGSTFRYTYNVRSGEIRTYVVAVQGDRVTARKETT